MAMITVDSREQVDFTSLLLAELRSDKWNSKPLASGGGEIGVTVDTLDPGDFEITIDGTIIAALFERKTWKDLKSSIQTERANSQITRMIAHRARTGAKMYYIVEGKNYISDDTKIGKGTPVGNLKAKLRHIMIRDDIHVIHTSTPQHTAQTLAKIARDYLRLYRDGEISFPLQTTNSNQIIPGKAEVIPGKAEVIPGKAEVIPGKAEGSNDDSPITLSPEEYKTQLEMWKALPGVSDRVAAEVIQHGYLSEYLTGRSSLRDFSSIMIEGKFINAKAVRSLAAVIHGTDPTIAARVLEQIPRVSKDVSIKISEKFTLPELALLSTEEDIANLEITPSRRVGPALAMRVLGKLHVKNNMKNEC